MKRANSRDFPCENRFPRAKRFSRWLTFFACPTIIEKIWNYPYSWVALPLNVHKAKVAGDMFIVSRRAVKGKSRGRKRYPSFSFIAVALAIHARVRSCIPRIEAPPCDRLVFTIASPCPEQSPVYPSWKPRWWYLIRPTFGIPNLSFLHKFTPFIRQFETPDAGLKNITKRIIRPLFSSLSFTFFFSEGGYMSRATKRPAPATDRFLAWHDWRYFVKIP